MTRSPTEITRLETQLATLRTTLAQVQRLAASPDGAAILATTRAAIAEAKAALRAAGVAVADHPDDGDPASLSGQVTIGGQAHVMGPVVGVNQGTLTTTYTEVQSGGTHIATGGGDYVQGNQEKINTGGGDYVRGDKFTGDKVLGDKMTISGVSDSIITLKSSLQHVQQQLQVQPPTLPPGLVALVRQVTHLLGQVPAPQARTAEAAGRALQSLVGALQRAPRDTALAQFEVGRFEQAAEPLAAVLPALPALTATIAQQVRVLLHTEQ